MTAYQINTLLHESMPQGSAKRLNQISKREMIGNIFYLI
jgi:hypothetical protein